MSELLHKRRYKTIQVEIERLHAWDDFIEGENFFGHHWVMLSVHSGEIMDLIEEALNTVKTVIDGDVAIGSEDLSIIQDSLEKARGHIDIMKTRLDTWDVRKEEVGGLVDEK